MADQEHVARLKGGVDDKNGYQQAFSDLLRHLKVNPPIR